MPGMSPQLRTRLRGLFRVVGALSPRLAARLAMYLFLTPIARPIRAEEARFLATGRAREFRTGHGRLQAYEWPAPRPGAATVLVVHGWISHTARMAEAIRALQARGLRVIAFDAPAHGRSAGRQADLQDFRAALAIVTAQCGPVDGVLAHSFGALTTATWLAEDRPSSVRAAVLVGMMSTIGYVFESFTLAVNLPPAVLQRTRELFRGRYGRYPEEFSTAERLRSLQLPLLLVHGGADELVPVAQAVEISAHLRNGQLLIATDLGHSAPLRDPATVARIADFLAERLAA